MPRAGTITSASGVVKYQPPAPSVQTTTTTYNLTTQGGGKETYTTVKLGGGPETRVTPTTTTSASGAVSVGAAPAPLPSEVKSQLPIFAGRGIETGAELQEWIKSGRQPTASQMQAYKESIQPEAMLAAQTAAERIMAATEAAKKGTPAAPSATGKVATGGKRFSDSLGTLGRKLLPGGAVAGMSYGQVASAIESEKRTTTTIPFISGGRLGGDSGRLGATAYGQAGAAATTATTTMAVPSDESASAAQKGFYSKLISAGPSAIMTTTRPPLSTLRPGGAAAGMGYGGVAAAIRGEGKKPLKTDTDIWGTSFKGGDWGLRLSPEQPQRGSLLFIAKEGIPDEIVDVRREYKAKEAEIRTLETPAQQIMARGDLKRLKEKEANIWRKVVAEKDTEAVSNALAIIKSKEKNIIPDALAQMNSSKEKIEMAQDVKNIVEKRIIKALPAAEAANARQKELTAEFEATGAGLKAKEQAGTITQAEVDDYYDNVVPAYEKAWGEQNAPIDAYNRVSEEARGEIAVQEALQKKEIPIFNQAVQTLDEYNAMVAGVTSKVAYNPAIGEVWHDVMKKKFESGESSPIIKRWREQVTAESERMMSPGELLRAGGEGAVSGAVIGGAIGAVAGAGAGAVPGAIAGGVIGAPSAVLGQIGGALTYRATGSREYAGLATLGIGLASGIGIAGAAGGALASAAKVKVTRARMWDVRVGTEALPEEAIALRQTGRIKYPLGIGESQFAQEGLLRVSTDITKLAAGDSSQLGHVTLTKGILSKVDIGAAGDIATAIRRVPTKPGGAGTVGESISTKLGETAKTAPRGSVLGDLLGGGKLKGQKLSMAPMEAHADTMVITNVAQGRLGTFVGKAGGKFTPSYISESRVFGDVFIKAGGRKAVSGAIDVETIAAGKVGISKAGGKTRIEFARAKYKTNLVPETGIKVPKGSVLEGLLGKPRKVPMAKSARITTFEEFNAEQPIHLATKQQAPGWLEAARMRGRIYQYRQIEEPVIVKPAPEGISLKKQVLKEKGMPYDFDLPELPSAAPSATGQLGGKAKSFYSLEEQILKEKGLSSEQIAAAKAAKLKARTEPSAEIPEDVYKGFRDLTEGAGKGGTKTIELEKPSAAQKALTKSETKAATKALESAISKQAAELARVSPFAKGTGISITREGTAEITRIKIPTTAKEKERLSFKETTGVAGLFSSSKGLVEKLKFAPLVSLTTQESGQVSVQKQKIGQLEQLKTTEIEKITPTTPIPPIGLVPGGVPFGGLPGLTIAPTYGYPTRRGGAAYGRGRRTKLLLPFEASVIKRWFYGAKTAAPTPELVRAFRKTVREKGYAEAIGSAPTASEYFASKRGAGRKARGMIGFSSGGAGIGAFASRGLSKGLRMEV